MISFAERECFSAQARAIWLAATILVNRVSAAWSDELRCHELARAIQTCLQSEGHRVTLVDGRLWIVEHSWLKIPSGRDSLMPPILDVYCLGRLPQVQLIDDHMVIARGYEPGPLRTDIRQDIIDRLVKEMAG